MSDAQQPLSRLNRRQFLGMSAAMAAGLPALAQAAPAPRRRPNLLFVFSDQQSRDMVGCYGNEQIITPRLDRFAAEGVKFDHCIASCPVCSPYRGMLLTGQHPYWNGVYNNDQPLILNNGKSFGQALGEAGYRTGYIGKWHLLGGNRDRPIPRGSRFGFEDYFLSNNCHVNFLPGNCFYWNEAGEKVYFDEWEVYGQTRQALSFLDECTPEEPFALFVSWHPPHDQGIHIDSLVYRYPMIEEKKALYDPAKLKLRPSVEDPGLAHLREAYRDYYANCTGVDEAFGWLMDKLKEKGLDENTVVVFTSDHGDNLASYGHTFPKCHPEDTSCRVPLMIRWPGKIKPGQTSEQIVATLDLMPTLLGMLDLPVPATCQGDDLSMPILEERDNGTTSAPLFYNAPMWRGVYTREATFAYGNAPHFMVTGTPPKLKVTQIPCNVLYDKRTDPLQVNNLYNDAASGPLRAEMEQLTQHWMDRFEDRMPDEKALNAHYHPGKEGWVADAKDPAYGGRPIDIIRKNNL